MSNGLMGLVQKALSCGHWCVLLAALAICVMYRHLSRWLWVTTLGLAGMLGTDILQQIYLVLMVNRQRVSPDSSGVLDPQVIFAVFSVLHIGAWIVFVAGLGLTFGDIHRQLAGRFDAGRPAPPLRS
jgi:hypothetical protein